jgi:ATP-dependent Lhr-like helicase
MNPASFHPAVSAWFERRFPGPTEAQERAWPSIQAGRHTLIAAPTGSGKTLAAFLAALDDLVRRAERDGLADETHVLYVSPLKALSNDVERNLREPLAGIGAELAVRGRPEIEIRVLVRTGDTPARQREAMARRPPHIVVTTPESLYILLTSERGRRMLQTVRTMIVDEIHAVVGTKRGSHLALSLERLADLTGKPPVRIGLSATQRPIEEVARFLTGASDSDCSVIDTGHARKLDLAVEIPASLLEAVMSNEVWEEIYDRLAALIDTHRTTLVFVNTRKMAERTARHLSERLGEENVTSHHGSLSREQRLEAEERLKTGSLKALVATASLELGIDIGDVDLVCQLGSTRSIATLLQRVGRSGHAVTGLPKGRLFPLSRDELVECAALLDAIARGELDRLRIPTGPLDILAQQITAEVAASGERTEEELFATVRRAHPYRDLPRRDFDAVVKMLADGFATRLGRRGAWIHRDAVNRRLRPRRGARLAAITSGGAIPDNADYRVVLEPAEVTVGTVNEDFAVESMAGDVFQLGNASWRITRIEPGTVRVEDAHGQPPSIPFWFGEAPARTDELSAALSRVRSLALEGTADEVRERLAAIPGLPGGAATQITDYLVASRGALGTLPTTESFILERFFDESGGMQLVLHAPLGSRLNRAWGLALRKRFCRKFNFELQAAADENAIVLSLGPTHSFPLEDVFRYLNAATVGDVLTQALLDAPLFAVRWRWTASRALAVLRFRGGKKVAPQLQRMEADDLVSVVFPDQMACLENVAGDREIPDHPLVAETLRDCLADAMDLDGLMTLLAAMERGEVTLTARDLREPSPVAQEILNAKPYAFLDDAPLEERRTQAVMSRRWLDPETASDLGALDAQAIERVRSEAWPEARTPDELHDALLLLGFITAPEGAAGEDWSGHREALAHDRRAAVLSAPGLPEPLWVAAERLPDLLAVVPGAIPEPAIASPEPRSPGRDEALRELVRARLEGLGPVTTGALGAPLGLSAAEIESALTALETEGIVLRGRFTPGTSETEWCERGLLARIHRYTLKRLRREIEPVSPADFLRFLFRWQGVAGDERAEGPASLARAVEQLEGFEAPAASWESDILPARVADYDPAWLDSLCLSGRTAWARVRPAAGGARGETDAVAPGGATGPVRTTPVALVARRNLPLWLGAAPGPVAPDGVRGAARAVLDHLEGRGASFFEEILAATGLLRTQIENALGELVAAGLVTADGFTGLRALLVPSGRRRPVRGGSRRGRRAPFGVEDGGRWSVLPRPAPDDATSLSPEDVETIARVLLRRYGVVFRKLTEREGPLPPWRDLLRIYRRLEARGEIRGGRFVNGFSGEQYALPEAVGSLREARRKGASGELVAVSGADPLNLVGILTPGPRLPALTANRVLYRDGVPLAVRAAGETRILEQLNQAEDWEARRALARRPRAPRLRIDPGR